MKTPTLHLNGTNGKDLRTNFEFAAKELKNAIEALSDARPNARDYYPQGEGAFRVADAEHRARMTKLQDVRAELLELTESVQAQLDARANARAIDRLNRGEPIT